MLMTIWTLIVLVGGMFGIFICGFILGIEYTQMEEDEYENGRISDRITMKIGKKIIDFWH